MQSSELKSDSQEYAKEGYNLLQTMQTIINLLYIYTTYQVKVQLNKLFSIYYFIIFAMKSNKIGFVLPQILKDNIA
jgi:hypothetical protein